MSPKNLRLTVGLTALGLFAGYTATRAAYSGEPPAPSGQPSPPAPSPTPTVLLLSDGRILRGTIAEEGQSYVIRQPGGEIRVRKDDVERTFDSVAAIYRYKLESVPDRDPDEHLKLARWCLIQNMPAEAKAQLQAVVALSPGASQARTMLANLEAAEARRRASRPSVDSGLVKTGVDVPEPAATDSGRPAEMDAGVLRRIRREMGVSTLPVIFDLPPAFAVKRADEFARNVHPILQRSCVKCHNERSEGRFQLIEVKGRRDLTADLMRANLDATLQLVDPENPARSQLLSMTLVPHGAGANKRPIFRGSNDLRFQIVSAWVNSLRAARPTENVAQTKFGAKDAPGGGGFGSDRQQGTGNQPFVITSPETMNVRKTEIQPPPSRFVPGQGMVAEKTPPTPGEFPLPFAVTGQNPPRNGGVPGSVTPVGNPPLPKPGTIPTPLRPGTAAPPTAGPAAMPVKPKTPLKIDPQLLEKAILNRNIGR